MPDLRSSHLLLALDGRESLPVNRMTRRRMSEVYGMRFRGVDETRFLRHNDQSRVYFRVTAMLAGALLALILTGIDHLLPAIPEAHIELRQKQVFFGVLPVAIIAATIALRPSLRRYSEFACAAGMTLISLLLVFQRYSGLKVGLEIPMALIALPPFIGLLLCRVRWRVQTPQLAGIYLIAVAAELNGFRGEIPTLGRIYSFTLMTIVIAAGSWVVEVHNRLTWIRRDYLHQLSRDDSLTGLLNKRAFQREYRRLFKLASREHRPITVVVLDLDHFKAYNDHYGHPAGDHCLKQIASALRSQSRRPSDIIARIGGEEFALVWYGVNEDNSRRMIEGLLIAIRDLKIPHHHTGTARRYVSASIGARRKVPDAQLTAGDLLHEADQLLYKSKHNGRDCYTLQ